MPCAVLPLALAGGRCIALPCCSSPCQWALPGQRAPPEQLCSIEAPTESEQEQAHLHALKTQSTHTSGRSIFKMNSLWPCSYGSIKTKLFLDSLPQGQGAAFMVTEVQSLSCLLLFSLDSSRFPSPSVTCPRSLFGWFFLWTMQPGVTINHGVFHTPFPCSLSRATCWEPYLY